MIVCDDLPLLKKEGKEAKSCWGLMLLLECIDYVNAASTQLMHSDKTQRSWVIPKLRDRITCIADWTK